MSQKVILENKSIENINLSQVQNADTLDGYHFSDLNNFYISNQPDYRTESQFYVNGDTHILKLGYFICNGSYQNLTLLISSAF